MVKVWLVNCVLYDSVSVIGIYDELEKAKSAAEQHMADTTPLEGPLIWTQKGNVWTGTIGTLPEIYHVDRYEVQ